jgi:hypothetical protein
MVTACHASIVAALALNVHVAHPVFTAGHPRPVQSFLHLPG